MRWWSTAEWLCHRWRLECSLWLCEKLRKQLQIEDTLVYHAQEIRLLMYFELYSLWICLCVIRWLTESESDWCVCVWETICKKCDNCFSKIVFISRLHRCEFVLCQNRQKIVYLIWLFCGTTLKLVNVKRGLFRHSREQVCPQSVLRPVLLEMGRKVNKPSLQIIFDPGKPSACLGQKGCGCRVWHNSNQCNYMVLTTRRRINSGLVVVLQMCGPMSYCCQLETCPKHRII